MIAEPSDAAARRPVLVELVLLAARPVPGGDGGPDALVAVVTRTPLPKDRSPDQIALAGCPAEVEVVHSTSWRMDGTTVVLTYAALPAPQSRADPHAQTVAEPSVVCSGDPLQPTPGQLHEHHVVAHAVRHLAQLVLSDPGIGAAARASRDPHVWRALAAAAAVMPTARHDAAHAAAHHRLGEAAGSAERAEGA